MTSDTEKVIREAFAESILLRSKVDALTATVGALLQKMNLPTDSLDSHVKRLTSAVHQKRLERLEDIDAQGSALLDDRDESDFEGLDFSALDSIRFLDNHSS